MWVSTTDTQLHFKVKFTALANNQHYEMGIEEEECWVEELNGLRLNSLRHKIAFQGPTSIAVNEFHLFGPEFTLRKIG